MNLKKMMTTMNSTALDFFLTFSIYFVNIKTNEKKKYWELKSRKVHHISNNLPFHLIVTKKLALNFSCEVLYPLCLHYRSFFNVYKQYQNDCRCYILIYMSDIKEPIHPLKALDETNPIFASPTVLVQAVTLTRLIAFLTHPFFALKRQAWKWKSSRN
jgi:hypothetical protein